MTTRTWTRLMSLVLLIFLHDQTVAKINETIKGRGDRSTNCTAVKNDRAWIFSPPAEFPALLQQQKQRRNNNEEHLEQQLRAAATLLEQVNRGMTSLRTNTKDCSDVLRRTNGTARSGVHVLLLDGGTRAVPVYCRMEAGRGWTVLQRRQDGSVDFYRTWEDYKRGFGNLTAEFWLGNDNIHLLTKQGRYTLRVDMENFDGETPYAEYDYFSTGDETARYRLVAGRYSGTAGDGLLYWRGSSFSTWDRPGADSLGQPKTYRTAGWFTNTAFPNPNGVYYTPQEGPHTDLPRGSVALLWLPRIDSRRFRVRYPILKFFEMRIVPAEI